MSVLSFLAVGLGGALGALCRHKASTFMKLIFKSAFPWPTFFINLCATTIAVAALASSSATNQTFYTALTMGVLGGFSTLSTMNCEAVDLILGGKRALGVAYVAATYACTLGAAALGFVTAHHILY